LDLESAVAGFERRFLTTDCTDFHGLDAEYSEFAENETLHRLGEELGFITHSKSVYSV
jgi:hypothetical protein